MVTKRKAAAELGASTMFQNVGLRRNPTRAARWSERTAANTTATRRNLSKWIGSESRLRPIRCPASSTGRANSSPMQVDYEIIEAGSSSSHNTEIVILLYNKPTSEVATIRRATSVEKSAATLHWVATNLVCPTPKTGHQDAITNGSPGPKIFEPTIIEDDTTVEVDGKETPGTDASAHVLCESSACTTTIQAAKGIKEAHAHIVITSLPKEVLDKVAENLELADVMALRYTCRYLCTVATNSKQDALMKSISPTVFGPKLFGVDSDFENAKFPGVPRHHHKSLWDLLTRLERDLPDYDLCYYCSKLHRDDNLKVCCVRSFLINESIQLSVAANKTDRFFFDFFFESMNFARLYNVMKKAKRGETMAGGPAKTALIEEIGRILDGFAQRFSMAMVPCAFLTCKGCPGASHDPRRVSVKEHVEFRVWPTATYKLYSYGGVQQIVKSTELLVCVDPFTTRDERDLVSMMRCILYRTCSRMCAHNTTDSQTIQQKNFSHALRPALKNEPLPVDSKYNGSEPFVVHKTRCPQCPTSLQVDFVPNMNLAGIYFVIRITQNFGTCATPVQPGWFTIFGDRRDVARLSPPGEIETQRTRGTPGSYTAHKDASVPYIELVG